MKNFVKDTFNIGDVIGDMQIISYGKATDGHFYLNCRCVICNKNKIIYPNNINRHPGTISHEYCKFGLREQHLRLYNIWRDMKTRIYNPNDKSYPRYGAVGLTTDYDRFEDFVNDLAESYYLHVQEYGEYDTTLDRIDNNLGYVRGNLRWNTRLGQSRNRRCMTRCFYAYEPEYLGGHIYISNNQRSFAFNHNLCQGRITSCLNNSRPHHKGWKFIWCDNVSLLFAPNNVIQEFYY